ncbi:MAG TPA: apolipoprotein N-acyltransferase [Thermoanaerobaculia bacterium]|nr:apolipoprotein N-acyltransferase [Thermoanaerobaculia bacterium]
MRSRLLWPLLAAAGGVLWGASFGRVPLGVAAAFTLVPLPLLLAHPRPGALAFVHGLASWLTALYWIVPTLVTYGGLSAPLAVALTTLLASFLALFHAVFGWLGGPLWRRCEALPRLLALPALWVALEWLRTYFLGGFPWNLAAYAWIAVPGALPLASFIGAYGISFLLLFSAVGVATTIERAARGGRRRWAPLGVGLAVPLLLLAPAGRWSLRRAEQESGLAARAGLPVRLLQPDIPNLVRWDEGAVLRNYRKVVAMSSAECEPGALVVWPESAAWPFLYGRDALLDRDLAAQLRRGCAVLFNSSFPVGDSFYNSAFLLVPGEPAVRYDKRHLVPFGEYVPFKAVFSFLHKLARTIGEYRPADRLALLPWRGQLLGPAICYEVVFPEETAALTRAGATILVTVTNDAWYGDTWAPWQHLRAARFRAAENRRPMLRAAITGVSALINPDGSVAAELGVFEEGVIRGRVAGSSGLTPYARRPWLPPLLCSAATPFAIYFSRRRS